jgi:hypothetical protein
LIELTPQQAALIAQNVYNVLPVVQDMQHVDLGIDDLFSVENDHASRENPGAGSSGPVALLGCPDLG